MEDYERANAREWNLHYNERPATEAPSNSWQVVSNSTKPEPLPQRQSPQKWQNVKNQKQPRRPPPRMTLDIDNEGQMAWRNKELPNASIRIPDELALQDMSHTAIASHHGAFIFSEHKRGNAGSMTFGLWGDSNAVAAAKQAIDEWIQEWRGSQKTNRSAKFAKVQSLTPELRKREEKKWEREVRRAKYRQFPPPHLAFGAIGSFHWPVQEYRPEEVLGTSFEALDPVRMDCSCYVLFDGDRSLFQVMGKSEDVQAALLRLRGTCFQIVARQISPLRLYLIDWSDDSNVPSHVYLTPYELMTHVSNDRSADVKTGWSPRAEGVGSDDGVLETMGVSEARVRTSILQTLKKLHYYRGSIQMRIRLGTFLATQYKVAKDGMYELRDFEDMLSASQFIGQVTEELGEKSMEQNAVAMLQGADDLLTPLVSETKALVDVKPEYSAIFTFADDTGDLRLSMTWQEAIDASCVTPTFEVISTKWTRLERDTGTTHPVLDISLCYLDTGMAWQFDLQAAQIVEEPRLPTRLAEFTQHVRIDPKEARKVTGDKPFIIHRPYAGHLKSIQQRISYCYRFGASKYKVELTRFQTRTYPPRKSIALPLGEATVYEPRWSLQVYGDEWDMDFARNERLPIGGRADWSHDMDTWFPEDLTTKSGSESAGAGFGQLMEKLKTIAKLVREAKEEDLMDGMAIG